MYEFKCPACGRINRVERQSQVQIYCGKSCALKHRYMMIREKAPKPVPRDPQYGDCLYSPEGVSCYRRECSKCGWNPTVAQERLERLGVRLPEP